MTSMYFNAFNKDELLFLQELVFRTYLGCKNEFVINI